MPLCQKPKAIRGSINGGKMTTAIEETTLATRTEQSFELAPTAGAAEKQFEIQSAIVIARRFPRDEDQAFARLMKSAKRPSFAEDASYQFPRGKVKDEKTGKWVTNFVNGPSVYIAREAARVWGNIRYGLEVIRDDDETRQIRGWAWDIETNVKVTAEDDFKKLVQRKQYDSQGKSTGTAWVTADERDLRELTNRRGAILVRNSILQLLPSDIIEDVRAECDRTIENGAKEDPEAAKKKLIVAFASLNVMPEMLEQKLGHKLAECSPAEIAELRKIYKSIADGNSTWAEYIDRQAKEPEKGTLKPEDLKPGKEENRGHGNENLNQVGKASPKAPQATAESQPKQTSTKKADQPKPSSVPLENPNYAEGGDPDPLLEQNLFAGREPGMEG